MAAAAAAKAVLTCRPNSHPFQERTLSLEQPAKVGRSVARARPAGNNAIFDCKVLSRNHALVWHENGKFFLQDTKSSNGTFVNNLRLSKTGEESDPREVCSGDIVQFGVDVMEVNKKLTHGCIVATLQLFLPDGKEAKASPSTPLALSDKVNPPLQDIYLLNQYVKECIQKEQMLEHKLATFSQLIQATERSSNHGWKAMIEEDRLLTRIDILERQLETNHKSVTDEKLRDEITQLHADKERYQAVAKDALLRAFQDKLELQKKIAELDRAVETIVKEKELLQQSSDKQGDELREVAEMYETTLKKAKELDDQFTALSDQYVNFQEMNLTKTKAFEDLLMQKQKVIDALITKVDVAVARAVLVEFNDSSELVHPENDSNKAVEEEGDESNEVFWKMQTSVFNRTGVVNDMKSQLLVAEKEKGEIQVRLLQLLSLFEDLKAVSNKVQASEYLTEAIGKVDNEIHQIRNFIRAQEEKTYITANAIETAENHVNTVNADELKIERDAHKVTQKLLNESRTRVQVLEDEANSNQRNIEGLQGKLDLLEFDNERARKEIDFMTNKFVTERMDMEERVNMAKKTVTERDEKINGLKDQIDVKRNEINSLRDEISALTQDGLEQRISARKGIQKSLDMRTRVDDLTRRFSNGDGDGSEDSARKNSESNEEMLLTIEEELAVYKTKYHDMQIKFHELHREHVELQDTLPPVPSKATLAIGFGIIVLFLAMLIGFRPSW